MLPYCGFVFIARFGEPNSHICYNNESTIKINIYSADFVSNVVVAILLYLNCVNNPGIKYRRAPHFRKPQPDIDCICSQPCYNLFPDVSITHRT